ncbi:Rpn family recombination-promoting nuclease/putative transposase [uncultured Fibrobacter sp.]|uniref:Rpn family recombination-promoting nuclease/putative transposase n=1 Tax=uncultured Fibrobacter sp. TaxID=261512 RepID=UPI0025D6A408|nr:Rpn family recombination-promoting nuclease/putative transposase [uncultured Fibrobacter sp.]
MTIKSFDDLDITDPIMFGLVFSNKHIAKPFIEHLLGIKIDHLETPIPEAVLSYDAEHKGVRYDVFARETNETGETVRSFDLEMQMVDTKELPQRARYYQSICDGVALSKGDFYTRLKEQYIIFLCPIDVFGHNFPCYHFENRAREDSSITLNDLTFKNFYIFTRYKEFTDPVVKAYMKYFATKNADTHETRTINDQVSFYKDDTLIRSKYMTYEFDLHESKEEGRAEGKIEGKAEGKLEMVDAMFEKTKLTDEEISSISGIPLEEIQKRRTQHQK